MSLLDYLKGNVVTGHKRRRRTGKVELMLLISSEKKGFSVGRRNHSGKQDGQQVQIRPSTDRLRLMGNVGPLMDLRIANALGFATTCSPHYELLPESHEAVDTRHL